MMKMKASFVLFACILLGGCGDSAPEKPAVKAKEKEEEAPAKPEAPKGLGLSQAKLLTGMGITLDRTAIQSSEGNTYMGDTGDGGQKWTKLVAYGTAETVTHAYLLSALPFADNPDAAKYPDYMTRNLKLRDTFLTNLFGSVPPDVKAALDWAKDNAKKEKAVSVDGKSVKIKYEDNAMSIDVK